MRITPLRHLLLIVTSFLVVCCSIKASAQSVQGFVKPKRGITSWQPAANWEHALLSGNGTMGALVMGQPYDETIILSHSALYLPQKQSKQPIDQASRLDEIRKLMLQGKYREASLIPVDQRAKEDYTDARDPFIPAFDVRIVQQPLNIKKYQRSVNFETGEAIVDWESDKASFQRKLFVSRTDSVIVISIKGTEKINCSINFEHRPIDWQQWQFVKEGIGEMKPGASAQWLTYRSSFKVKNKSGLEGYEGVGRLVLSGGNSEVKHNKLIISNADEVLLLIKIVPSYNYNNAQTDQLKQVLLNTSVNYNKLLTRHFMVHGELFNRIRLNLNSDSTEQALFTEELILKAKQQVPLAIIEKTFDAGRYNIISSTGYNPPNLQGLWSGTWTAPWTGGFTNDGNLATAVGGLLPCNMPELMNSFFNYHERLMNDYRQSAVCLYNCRGIHIPAQATTTGWDTDFGETWCLTFWTGAAGWTANFFNEYWLYTGDKTFLKERAYPFMKEAALFYEDFLTTGADGKLVFNPSYSPENNPGNNTSQAALNATMDVMIAKQLLRNCIAAAKVLNTDQQKIKKWETMLNKMPAYQVASDGSFREWLWEGVEENHKHRHTSQLYSLYDHADPEIVNNPVLVKAVGKTIEEKMKFRVAEEGGEMAFGLVFLGLSAAHVGDVEKTAEIVKWLSSKYWSNGMGSFHNVGALFNTDISGGLPYLITQMLVYSEPGLVSLLPVLPTEWKQGEIEGVLLRGQIEVKKLSWNGKKVEVILKSAIDQKITLKLPANFSSITSADCQVKNQNNQSNTCKVQLTAGKPVTVTVLLK
ncbi:glycoside hydrolase family 95 protein [Solitalea sp. MAHUQ-68]|uniref:Glycoside hydrolase family 95 protein n=1 Tax=Solitalea agri TaxID=2953739 RepID=A0A9X2EZX8_9SPHI|nr:glycoside hydrolase N-terminal domain-containing protein [Solitalea agri]MCO4291570.1 glycoside hydrolase family 95 protein [Solitalea agri]